MRTKPVSSNAMVGELRSLTMVGSGLVAGSMAGKAIDNMLKVDNTLPGFQPKKLVRPAAQLITGIMASLKFRHPDLKNAAAGFGASGLLSAAQVILKKDLLNGLNGPGQAMSVYSDAMSAVAAYEPDLPMLASGGSGYPSENTPNAYISGEEISSYQDAEIEII